MIDGDKLNGFSARPEAGLSYAPQPMDAWKIVKSDRGDVGCFVLRAIPDYGSSEPFANASLSIMFCWPRPPVRNAESISSTISSPTSIL